MAASSVEALTTVNLGTWSKSPLARSLVAHLCFLAALGIADYGSLLQRERKSLQRPVEVTLAPPPRSLRLGFKGATGGSGLPAGSAQSVRQSGLSGMLKAAQSLSAQAQAQSARGSVRTSDWARVQRELSQGKQEVSSLGGVTGSSVAKGALQQAAKAQWGQGTGGVNWNSIGTETGSRGDLSPADLAAIRAALAGKQRMFRDCYERALLAQSDLMGQAELLLHVSETGAVHRSQIGLKWSRSARAPVAAELQGCLERVARQIVLPKSVGNQRVQFELLLQS